MKKRWLLNLIMLAVVAGLVTFLYMRPQANTEAAPSHEVSTLKMADFNAIKVEFPTKAPTSFAKTDGQWRMTSPYKMRADQLSVQRILSIIAAKSADKFPTTDLAKYGLDNPQLRLKLTNTQGEQVFSFGTFNPVTEEQYVAFNDAIYMLSVGYAEAASTQPIELIDKNILTKDEVKQIAGFDFSRLEQWADLRLNVALTDGQWKVNAPKAKITQNEMNEWLDFSWKQAQANKVELYTPERNANYPSFAVKLKNGKSVRFDKVQESPDLLLGRPDEGLLYHFNADVGFNMLNPPLNIQ